MKLVRINDDMILDLDDVQFAIWNDQRERVLIGFKSNPNGVTTDDKAVLDAIAKTNKHSLTRDDLDDLFGRENK